MTPVLPLVPTRRRGRAVRYAGPALALATAALLFSGCASLRTKYERPPVALPDAYSETPTTASATIPDAWWKLFGDPNLDRLVDEALGANQDLAAAAARVE